jgi:acyl-CoA thioester hydrolase
MEIAAIYQHDFRVYAEHVDFMGIVYHANFLCFFERARTEMLRENNLILSDLMKQDLLFAVHKVDISYKAPARLDDLLTIKTQVHQLGAFRFIFDQFMYNQEDKLISEAKIQVVSVDSNLKPKRYLY